VILMAAILVCCGSGPSPGSSDAAGVADERPEDGRPADSSSGGGREGGADIDGDCTPATAFTCVASCGSAVQTQLICDDGHWECERGVDARQCAAAGT
jgi:hypothetical protein